MKKQMKKFWNKPWKLVLLGAVGFVVFAILHNVAYMLLGFEEPVFFLLAVLVSPGVVLVGIGKMVAKGFAGRGRG